MNQSEETTVTALAGHPEPHTNGQDKNDKAKTAYQGLQKLIGHEIAQIDKILRAYYEEYGNQYYLVDTPRELPHKDLFKWTIGKNGDDNIVEVFFKAKGESKSDTHTPQMAAGAPAPVPPTAQAKTAQTQQSQSANIYTYDEVGAPPSGPTPAKPPSNP
jgi:hypothetical protein